MVKSRETKEEPLEKQLKEETELNQRILENLAKVKLPDDSLKVDNYE
ncbi:MAG: hypothetical protein LHW64_10980 [Candidatus Cloacimonetes bacterium]|jgi:hypothetical protein|nr:hypothetical protein [Candidatus Cloacimonadota bacterium]MCB5288305.1 hypothetical protein [Candidatus Cloacimonadota bacterium]MCK9185590.1 hypothetical protein [Candidatus Cloacimonadota bacterium]MCK9583345.1 hypothetical protein [Candidatus Cloacimonadota bacterium]MDY0230620.1 hypothetical protein [Candidatus Cloacimonadaceae bacterium]